jgi:hypothetical protein
MWSVGFKLDLMDQIIPYPFGYVTCSGALDQDPTVVI